MNMDCSNKVTYCIKQLIVYGNKITKKYDLMSGWQDIGPNDLIPNGIYNRISDGSK